MLSSVLEAFCSASGLKVNLEKSIFMASNNVSRLKCDKFARMASIQPTSNIGKHLGFPMIKGRTRTSDSN